MRSGGALEGTRELMEETSDFHIKEMRLHGEIVPEPSSLAQVLTVASERPLSHTLK